MTLWKRLRTLWRLSTLDVSVRDDQKVINIDYTPPDKPPLTPPATDRPIAIIKRTSPTATFLKQEDDN